LLCVCDSPIGSFLAPSLDNFSGGSVRLGTIARGTLEKGRLNVPQLMGHSETAGSTLKNPLRTWNESDLNVPQLKEIFKNLGLQCSMTSLVVSVRIGPDPSHATVLDLLDLVFLYFPVLVKFYCLQPPGRVFHCITSRTQGFRERQCSCNARRGCHK